MSRSTPSILDLDAARGHLTWHPALNRWCDQTGVAHLLGSEGGALCGTKVHALGGGFADPSAAGCRGCQKCVDAVVIEAQRKALRADMEEAGVSSLAI